MVNRVVVGAHYGLRDWLAQRITALIIAMYSVIVVATLIGEGTVNYAVWRDLFAQGWMRVTTLIVALSVAWHMWVGVRDILMDYVPHAGLRLALQTGVVVLVAGYAGWTIHILWR